MLVEKRMAIQTIADFVRRLTTSSATPPFDARAVLEFFGGEIKELEPEEIQALKYGDDFEAVIETTTEDSPEFSVSIAAQKPQTRTRFTFAHELGHLVLHLLGDNGKLKPGQTTFRNSRTSEEELDANEFAAAFLMPQDLFTAECKASADAHDGKVNIPEVAKKFGVSVSAATVRGNILSLW